MEDVGPIDNRKAECPNCLGALVKIPGRKTKCPLCGEYMFVRTRPNRERVVVSENEAARIDEEWALLFDIPDGPSTTDGEGSDLAGRWESLNRELSECASTQDWGLYRNCRHEMADQLMRESEFQGALNYYLEVCYLDLNGPRNCGGDLDVEFLKEFPPFDPDNAFLASGIVEQIQRLGRRLKIRIEDVKDAYLEHNSSVYQSLALPRSPESTWSDLANGFSRLHDLVENESEETRLDRLLGLIDATEAESQKDGLIPSPVHTTWVADIYSAREDFESEVVVLERYRRAVEANGHRLEPYLFERIRRARWLQSQGPIKENLDLCPSCFEIMNPPIKRSGKCSNCKEQIVARKVRGRTVLRTKEQQEQAQFEDETFEKTQSLMWRVNSLGISDEEFAGNQQRISEQNGRSVSPGDVYWALANAALHDAAQSPNPDEAVALIYRGMAEHLCDEGRDWLEVARQAVWTELRILEKSNSIQGLRVVPTCKCAVCIEDLRSVSLEEARSMMAPPHQNCLNPPCICTFYGYR